MTKTALVGLGRWGSRVAVALAEASDFQGYANRTKSEAGGQVNFPHMEVTTLLSRTDIQAVWIATPIDSHFEIAKQVLESGKHVMVEKPLSVTNKEAQRLVSLATSKNLLLATGYVFLFDPAFEELHREISNREVLKVNIRWHKYGTFEETLERNLLTHHLAMILSLFGEPRNSTVVTREAVESACDRMTSEYTYDGFTVTSEINRASMQPEHTIVVTCADGTEWYWSGGSLKKRIGEDPKQQHFRSNEMPLDREVKAWLTAITEHAPLVTQGDFGAKVLMLQEQVDALSAHLS